jgi:RimJ/RimL family protein N-acetyltransferase
MRTIFEVLTHPTVVLFICAGIPLGFLIFRRNRRVGVPRRGRARPFRRTRPEVTSPESGQCNTRSARTEPPGVLVVPAGTYDTLAREGIIHPREFRSTRGPVAKTVMETDRVTLREFTLSDVDDLHRLHTDPDVMRYVPDERRDLPYLRTFVKRCIDEYRSFPGYGIWAAMEKSGKTFIGWFLLRPFRLAPYYNPGIADAEEIELGYRLTTAVWGRGYATEVAHRLIRYALVEGSARSVIAGVERENAASVRVLQKSNLSLSKSVKDTSTGTILDLYRITHADLRDFGPTDGS